VPHGAVADRRGPAFCVEAASAWLLELRRKANDLTRDAIAEQLLRTHGVNPERHEYELYLAVEDIDHSRTKTKSPQTNGICERFHKTALNEFYRVAFRKKVYRSLDELQADLDAWLADLSAHHNTHLSMRLKGRDFVDRDAIPRGTWGFGAPVR
jgi:transposase InsO family protein